MAEPTQQQQGNRRRACLIGIPDYDRFAPLPVVREDIRRLHAVLERNDYQVEAHCPEPGAGGVSKSRLRTLLFQACRAAEDGDTLVVYVSGHGGHYQGIGCLVPSDADLRFAEHVDECLLPLNVLEKAADGCRAATLVFLIDACREGIRIDAKSDLSVQPWRAEDLRIAAGRSVVTVFACEVGQVAQFHPGADGEPGYSLFCKALCDVLDPENPAARLGDVLDGTDRRLDRLVRRHGKAAQRIHVATEAPTGCPGLGQIICDAHQSAAAVGPNPWVDAVAATPLWPDDPQTAVFKPLAYDLAAACWGQRERARAALPGDPWVDDQLPVRLLGALALLVRDLTDARLNAAETALLCIAPFVREAVLARAIEHAAAEADPLELSDTGSGDGLRGLLEKTHRGLPRLVRKAERLRAGGAGEAAQHVVLWLLHRALLREPTIWLPAELGAATLGAEPARAGAGLLDGPLREALGLSGSVSGRASVLARDALALPRLLELARCCYAAPERIERGDRPGALALRAVATDRLGGEAVLRERLLGHLLIVAGAMALDPRVMSEVLVEHIGLPETPPLPRLFGEIAAARWEPDSVGRRLVARCTHPAPDFALAEQVEHANLLLAGAHRAVEHSDCAPLAGLPARLSAAGIAPAIAADGPLYRTPHLRFRLQQDQVLELLMGEQLGIM